jgi:predicted RNA binding protein YcfA (HicA-like mRNA interferase family)
MARKIRDLLKDLCSAGFYEISGGKGSHRKLVHPRYSGAITLSGNLADDAKHYQEKQVRLAIEEIQK